MSESYVQWQRALVDALPEHVEVACVPPNDAPAAVRGWARQPDGTLWAATDVGLWHCRGGQWTQVQAGETLYPLSLSVDPGMQPSVRRSAGSGTAAMGALSAADAARASAFAFPRAKVHDVAVDAAGMLWVATDAGLVVGDGQGAWYTLGALDGLPFANVRGVRVGPDTSLWVWFARGLARLSKGRWMVFGGPRWLPSDEVETLCVELRGDAWVKTRGGSAHIYAQAMTLAEKAAHYEAQIAERHQRHGFVAHCQVEDTSGVATFRRLATDNDGLWTALYVAAQSYRYAVTGDERARRLARRSMLALLELEAVTPIDGYPARAMVYDGENVVRSDPEHGEWHAFSLSDGRSGQWKGDTSSDEIVGHIYGLTTYFDLVADPDDRETIAEAMTRIADHIIGNGLCLVDVDGKPTTWGVWAPADLNGDLGRLGDRGLNSLEILALLRAAFHVTGDRRYLDVYYDLIHKHGYALNVIAQRPNVPGHVNHSDDELAFLSYVPLLQYESDPALRAIYLRGLERSWQLERPEHCPLWSFIYGALTGRPCDVDAALEALADIPLDLVNYPVDWVDRLDVTVRSVDDRHGVPQAQHPLRWLERPMMQWNGNPYGLRGGDGGIEEAGTFWLLPYWMGRFYGFIAV